jgi:hypothetical protein
MFLRELDGNMFGTKNKGTGLWDSVTSTFDCINFINIWSITCKHTPPSNESLIIDYLSCACYAICFDSGEGFWKNN